MTFKNVLPRLSQLSLVALLSVTLFIFVGPVQAEDLPFGVSPKQITVSGTINPPEKMIFGYSKGKLLDTYEYKEGNRVGVELESVSYSLTFWNVGKMGGTSGYLFWKKDFAQANLNLEYNIGNPGRIVGEKMKLGDTKLDSYKMEPADSDPDLDGISCGLSFSGGQAGNFKGSCSNGATIAGRVAGAGAFVVFDDIKQPEDPKQIDRALAMISHKDLRLNGEFADWKFDESTLEDSGARFSSLSGEVEVRHEKDTVWNFCKLDTPLYVLDHVKTSEESQAIIGFKDLSTFLLKAESEIVITTPPKKDSKIGLVWGNIKANVKKMMKDGTMEVEMSQAVAGIKGTRFSLTETGKESKVEVTEGVVAFRSKATNQTVMVGAGEAITATASGLSATSTFDAAKADQEILTETDKVDAPVVAGNDQGVEASSKLVKDNNVVMSVGIGLGIIVLILLVLVIIRKLSKRNKL